MKRRILHIMTCGVLLSGLLTPATAQLQSKINFTLQQEAEIETLTKEYKNQGLAPKEALQKAQEEVAPEVVRLRFGTGGGGANPAPPPYPSVARPYLNVWPVDHAAWVATPTYPGSIEVDRDTYIHGYTPSQLVKKVLLKAYTPQDEARVQNVRFLGFNGMPAPGGDGWMDNPLLAAYSPGNRGLSYFTKGSSSFDIDRGLLLSTGEAWRHEGPNEYDQSLNRGVASDGTTLATNSSPSFDPDLTTIAGQTTRCGGILEFDFSPAVDKASFEYVFGSEEYPEYVHSNYNDVFGFFVSGPYDSPSGSATTSLPGVNNKGRSVYNGDPINT